MNDKERVDTALVRRGYFESRERAQSSIMAGLVYIGEKKVNKPSETVGADEQLNVRANSMIYVSRGALKLEKAVRVFNAELQDKVIMDIGASTGGFTDICLREGARRVYSIDVGYGQLDWKIRNDPRVTVMERVNARYMKKEDFPEKPSITVMDVSFISIRLILPVAIDIMGDDGIIYTLIKPQFEAGRKNVGKKGVVRDPEIHNDVIISIAEYAGSIGWCVEDIDYSPITGPEGNIEFIAKIRKKNDDIQSVDINRIRDKVREAHENLGRKSNGEK